MYRLWETSDGHLMYFAATDSEFQGLFRAVGHPEWNDDPRFTSEGRLDPENSAELGTMLMTAIQSMTTQQCMERMVAEDVPVGPVLTLDELFDDEQIRHNEAILEFDHPTAGRFHQARPAARFDKTPQDPNRRMPPLHGEHTEEVLREAGLRRLCNREAARRRDHSGRGLNVSPERSRFVRNPRARREWATTSPGALRPNRCARPAIALPQLSASSRSLQSNR